MALPVPMVKEVPLPTRGAEEVAEGVDSEVADVVDSEVADVVGLEVGVAVGVVEGDVVDMEEEVVVALGVVVAGEEDQTDSGEERGELPSFCYIRGTLILLPSHLSSIKSIISDTLPDYYTYLVFFLSIQARPFQRTRQTLLNQNLF